MDIWQKANAALEQTNPVVSRGVVTDLTGLIIEGNGPPVGVGATCSIVQGGQKIEAQVVGFRKDRILLMPLGDLYGIAPGATILSHGRGDTVLVSRAMLGRVISPLGEPMDDLPLPHGGDEVPLYRTPPSPLSRVRIHESFDVGIKAVNSLLRVGRGQRVGIIS